MVITWDEPKRLVNIAKRGLDFADLRDEFFVNPLLTEAADNRFKAVNEMNGNLVVVVIFTPLGTEAVSIISLRRANRKERQVYYAKA